ncbi:protein kinase [Isoptericola halotolerans]|uniref:serine/threonine-protein kinase n=1 Tax=Isoptericola halotolerans TaxID=300560 RepID=UPI003890ACC5
MSPAGEPESGAVVLGGTYALGAILGTGGTYTVYEATRARATAADTDDDGTGGSGTGGEPALVVKVLHPHLVDDETARAALAREIAASALVDHPGVSKVLDTGEDEVAGATVPWVVARRLPGAPLSEVAAGDGLPWREALALTSGLLDALAAVHAAGLVHRDVGPRNVVVERHDGGDPNVGLLDLGLAAPGGGDGDGDLVAGSVASMSPEQAQGRPLDARSDLYAVGSLAYFALTGHAPYERARPDDILRAHVGAPVPAPSARRAAVPVAVDRFVARAMAKDPEHRFASADAMRAAAATLVGGGGAGAPGPGTTMTLGQIAAEDPDRTAVVGAAGAAAAAAAAADTEAELQRTRQLGAVGSSSAPAEDSPAPAVAAGAGAPEPSDDAPPGTRSVRRTVLAVVLALLLTAGGAGAFWALRDTDGSAPVTPATLSPSPSPSPSSAPTETATTAPPAVGPTTRPDPTTEPTPTPSATPSDDATPAPSPTEEPEPSRDPTPTPTSEPTPTDDPAPTEPAPTSEPEPTSEPDPPPTSEPEPTSEPGGGDPTDDGEPAADDGEPASGDDATP